MSVEDWKKDSAGMRSFSATGRPYKPKDQNDAMNNVMLGGEITQGIGPPNLLPFKYTDDSIITIPVLPAPDYETVTANDKKDSLPVKEEKKGGFLRRLSGQAKSKSKKEDFIMKGVRRGDYLKHYAKDDDGKYIGTEDPAPDCILNGDDVAKYRSPR